MESERGSLIYLSGKNPQIALKSAIDYPYKAGSHAAQAIFNHDGDLKEQVSAGY
jgi:hypothetical protein